MSKKWEYYKSNEDEALKLEQEYKINKLLANILANRGITVGQAKVFLNPTRKDFHNPFEMPDMGKAVERILKARENNEKVIIFGDYDVDGITSITVLKSFLKDIGIETSEYIPNRLHEGYGLNKDAIKKIAQEKYSLMITVDCGITGIEEIEYAKKLGIETIVTDHHEPANELPKAVAVVDCKRKDNKYPFRELAGVGVVFKLTQAIGIKLELPEKEYLKYLDIVALGTISDIVPLVDENRVITKLGLLLIAETKNCGLKALVDLAGYGKIDSTSISFGVAPKINACGRMGFAEDALKLLLSNNIEEATEKLGDIIKYNNERQTLERNIYEEAIKQIDKYDLNNTNSIVLGGYNWHTGVIGIVASKITELYFKPCILICFDEESNIGKGSGRSIPGFDLHDALMKCTDILEGFGGHSMAVGVAVKKDRFNELKQEFEKLADHANIKDILPVINIDMVLNIDEISRDMVESLRVLEPFGEANKTPIFAFKNLKIDSIRALTEGKHLKLTLKSNNNTYVNAIGFNLGHLSEEYKIGDRIDVAGSLEINSFNGVDSIQINLKDLMKTI
ncbi:MAG: single-stranded-DNA-specific exonuclease RecJ [Clostridia bacterium]|nr:single-stranded-DNA-specific exonuclease RecJ [Clostridia bacterium]